MGKKKANSGIGRTLIKDRFKGKQHVTSDTHLHTTDLNDGYDWNRLNLQSVTEQNTLDEFLATAELAGTEFQAEKLNITFISPGKHTGLLTDEELSVVKDAQDKHRYLLSIPRRPSWNAETTAEELDRKEKDSFLEWRRQLAGLSEVEGLVLTPFERNLDFWRQLWRVIERSDIVVQIVDSRNPLLFRCEDLEVYVKQINETKVNVILINKADFLTEKQRKYWADYFDALNVRVCFWSAVEETMRNQEKAKQTDITEHARAEDEVDNQSETDDEGDEDEEDETEESDTEFQGNKTQTKQQSSSKDDNEKDVDTTGDNTQPASVDHKCTCSANISNNEISTREFDSERCDKCGGIKPHIGCDSALPGTDSLEAGTSRSCDHSNNPSSDNSDSNLHTDTSIDSGDHIKNNYNVLTGDELLAYISQLHSTEKYTPGVTTIGLVGYPNVGKSSTINALLQTKKVPVSATPGRTKHFQTLYVEKTLMLCDCPGLVMPTFVSTKAEMIISGILPIDQMRDFVPPISLICKYMPRSVLETTYGFMLPKPNIDEGEDPDRLPTAHELLTAHACMRGFMTHKGVPDFQRSARVVLKDYVNGKLLYCCGPPGVADDDFDPVGIPQKPVRLNRMAEVNETPVVNSYHSSVDQDFFEKVSMKPGTKGVHGVVGYTRKDGYTSHHAEDNSRTDSKNSSQTSIAGKPWKKHGNKNKKEKLRRKHKDMDIHTNVK